MFTCKKRTNPAGTFALIALGVFALAGAAYTVCHLYKKCHCGCKHKESLFPNLDLCSDLMAERDHDCGCQVPDTDNDLRSDENRVVNSENRLINTPCEPDDFSNFEQAHDQ